MWESSVEPAAVRRVACVGAGVIGGGWVAHFLARGFEVTAWDPAPDAEAKLRRLVGTAWPTLVELGLAPGASRDRLTVPETLAEAVSDAQFVQESAPENLELKSDLLARIDAAAPAGIVVGSSTSGYRMTDMQAAAARPERLVVGHPFNPPYLLPLVEVVGGERTAAEAVRWAEEFYTHAGKTVIVMDREVPGFIANRLQEALWREALHMIDAGEATVDQIETAVIAGPGLRWPFHGPCTTFHLAGGEGGMAHALDHFGVSYPWTRLASPELTDRLRASLVEGTGRRSTADLVAERDRKVIAVLRAVRGES
ncbi:3-hydroxyacyl-CoA dehydrogenase NAD-binding domain-containing protein [Amycolatopsis jejuensis]|uniref:3-hydroxyacyl-CoA dehydrogenase NAD-binding domain-containing protein n=1 Tax=Amycolatopsis jejuensis TaxID=330084 RepID=UPI000527AFA2|nr:3-hydroxyacyl-CoA dehydrogenase NAD-binding domain-containing protein [Amycolatopsis jejuensis]